MRHFSECPVPPLRRETLTADQPRQPTWQNLNQDQRQLLLHALSRLLARHLPALVANEEVHNDRHK